MTQTVVVTGGAGYIGAPLCEELLRSGREVRALDSLLHGQADIADDLRAKGVTIIAADIRDEGARAEALDGADAVVHLAAIVGDPACALDPDLSEEVNVKASHDLIDQATASGVTRWIMASTCSNYGRMADPTVPITGKPAAWASTGTMPKSSSPGNSSARLVAKSSASRASETLPSNLVSGPASCLTRSRSRPAPATISFRPKRLQAATARSARL